MMPETAAPAVARLAAAACTDPGLVRGNNEDLAICLPDRGIYAVIDGVGGHAAGEVAAAIARDVILDRLSRRAGKPDDRVREAIALANNAIFAEAQRTLAYRGMTCVLTLALVTDDRLIVGHVGDTRLYTIRRGAIRKVTHDHSPIGEREDAAELSELDAMRHPRRNEVFRDLGSVRRDKDDPDFVELIVAPFERDAAILLCTDGLTDMVQSSAILHLVRRHAGDPDAVARALVDAAIDAGGKDNVTIVYAEGPRFAARADGVRRAEPPTVELPRATDDRGAIDRSARPPGGLRRGWRAFVNSRLTWFALGALACMGAMVLLVSWLGATLSSGRRTLVVSPTGSADATFRTIGDAMQAARPGDAVQVESGTYPEQVVIKDGVDLIAREPGTAELVARANAPAPWTAITARGELGGRIYGLKLRSAPGAAMAVGLSLRGPWKVDAVELTGVSGVGIELLPAADVIIRSSLFEVTRGTAVRVGTRSSVALIRNMFVNSAGPTPAVLIQPPAQATLTRNSFVGFGGEAVQGLSAEDHRQMLDSNFVIVPQGARPH